LENRETEGAVEVTEAESKGSGAGNGVLHTATHCRTQLREHERVEHLELELEPERDATGVERLRVLDGRRRSGVEDLALAAGLRLLLRGVVDLFEDAGNREEEG